MGPCLDRCLGNLTRSSRGEIRGLVSDGKYDDCGSRLRAQDWKQMSMVDVVNMHLLHGAVQHDIKHPNEWE